MEIILSILQMLGIVLLGLLGLLILIILLVLFVPIRYKVDGKSEETVYISGRIHWLLHLFRAKVSYEGTTLQGEVGIFWKKIRFSKDFRVSDKEENSTDDEETEENSEVSANKDTDLDKTEIADIQEDSSSQDAVEKADNETKEKSEDKIKKDDNETSSEKRVKKSWDYYKKKLTQIKKLIQDEKNKQAVKHLKEELFYLIKLLLPKKSALKGVFSTGSPDTTGQLFGVICCFPIIYQDNWSLTPDFEAEKPYFKGEFWGKGRIYVFQLVGILVRIVMDRNCRRLFYIIKRLGGQSNGRRK